MPRHNLIFLSALGYLLSFSNSIGYLNEASEWDGFWVQQVQISPQIRSDRQPCGTLEGIQVHGRVLCLTQILALRPWHQSYCQNITIYCRFLLVCGWEEKGKFTLMLNKALSRSPAAVDPAPRQSGVMVTCGELTWSTDGLHHFTSVLPLISKEQKCPRKSASFRSEFISLSVPKEIKFKKNGWIISYTIIQRGTKKWMKHLISS